MTTQRPSDAAAWRTFLSGAIGGWAGQTPATEQVIAAAEERLGVHLPASYRSFLLVSNGGDPEDTPVEQLSPLSGLLPVEEVDWARDGHSELVDTWNFDEEIHPLLEGSIVVGYGDDGGYWLLDPTAVEDGEWAAYHWFTGDGLDPEREPSFADAVASAVEQYAG